MTLHRCAGLVASALLAASTVLGPAEAAVTTGPYQAYINHLCPATGDCAIDFPAVPANYRVELSHVACYLKGDAEINVNFAELIVIKPGSVDPMAVDLNVFEGGGGGNPRVYTYSASADTSAFSVAGNHFQVLARPLSGVFEQLACGIDGRLVKLS